MNLSTLINYAFQHGNYNYIFTNLSSPNGVTKYLFMFFSVWTETVSNYECYMYGVRFCNTDLNGLVGHSPIENVNIEFVMKDLKPGVIS